MLLRTCAATVLALTLAACGGAQSGSDTSAPASAPAADAITVPASAPADTSAASAQASEDTVLTAFTAFGGNNSAWRAVVNNDQLSIEGTELKAATITVERSAYAKGVEFSGEDQGRKIGLNIRSEPCTLDGHENEFTATLDVGDKTFKGCAVAGAQEHAPT